jgi:hypothetical protein
MSLSFSPNPINSSTTFVKVMPPNKGMHVCDPALYERFFCVEGTCEALYRLSTPFHVLSRSTSGRTGAVDTLNRTQAESPRPGGES